MAVFIKGNMTIKIDRISPKVSFKLSLIEAVLGTNMSYSLKIFSYSKNVSYNFTDTYSSWHKSFDYISIVNPFYQCIDKFLGEYTYQLINSNNMVIEVGRVIVHDSTQIDIYNSNEQIIEYTNG